MSAQLPWPLRRFPQGFHPPATVRRSLPQRVLDALAPNLSYPLVLLGVALEPFVNFKLKGSVQIGDLFFLGALAALGIEVASGRSRLWAPLWMLFAIASMVLVYALQAFDGGDIGTHEDLITMVVIVFVAVLIPMIIASQRLNSPLQLQMLVLTWLLANLAGGLAGLLQQWGLQVPLLGSFMQHVGSRVAGFTPHPNNYGFFQALTAVLALALAFGTRSFFAYLFWLVCVALAFYGVDLSGSRTSLVTAMAGSGLVVAAFIILRRGRANWARHLLTVGAVSLASAAYLVYKSGKDSAWDRLFSDNHTATKADYTRHELLQLSIDQFWAHPATGRGYHYFIDPHNVYVSSAACGGVFGVLFLALVAGGLGWYALRLLVAAVRGQRDFTTAVGFVALYVCWLMVGFKESTLVFRDPLVALGLMCLLYNCTLTRPQPLPAGAAPPARFRLRGR